MDPEEKETITEKEINAEKNFYKFIKLINKIRKKIVSEKNIIDILKEYEHQLIELKDLISTSEKYFILNS